MKRSDAMEINSILAAIPGWRKSDKAIRFGADYGVQKGYVPDVKSKLQNGV